MKKRQIRNAIRKLWRHEGPLATALDGIKPRGPKPTRRERNHPVVKHVFAESVEIHRRAWREAVLEVTGEDPDQDWI